MKVRPNAPWATTTKPPTSGVKKSCLNCDYFIPNNRIRSGGICVAEGQKGMKISSRHLSPCKLYFSEAEMLAKDDIDQDYFSPVNNCVNCVRYKYVADFVDPSKYVYKCFHPSHGIAKLMRKPISDCPVFAPYIK